MYKLAVIGDRESVLGFGALGIEVFSAQSALEAAEILHRLAKGDYAIIYLVEQFAIDMKNDIDKYNNKLTPAIILIPGKDGSLGIGMANVKRLVERAVGADIL